MGQNVLRQLLQQGHTVHLVVREKAKRPELTLETACDASQIKTFVGSFLDFEVLSAAATGCDAIVNCAGTTDMALRHQADYYPVNRDACTTIVKTMECCGIGTLVHVSTANTIGYGTPQHSTDETAPMEAPFTDSYYALSKSDGEQIVAATAEKHPSWHVITVNPGFMLGAHDIKPSSGQLLLAAYRKPLMAVPCGGKSFINVSDAATAIVNAISMGRHGEHYLLTGKNMTLREFYLLQSQVCGYRQRVLILPRWLVLAAGRMGDAIRGLGFCSQVSTRNVRQLLVTEHYSNKKACIELLMPQSPLEDAIKAFFSEWKAR